MPVNAYTALLPGVHVTPTMKKRVETLLAHDLECWQPGQHYPTFSRILRRIIEAGLEVVEVEEGKED
jgi:hypothetical protein